MGYYMTDKGVEEYVQMAEGYDGRLLIDVLRRHVPAGSSVLEIGMGPGVDLDILGRTYEVTGSDNSSLFLDRYRASHPDADLLLLDAESPKTDRRFDCIYSNKVLMHLSRDALRDSLLAQAGLLNREGVAMHSLWWGDKDEEVIEGLRFVYYTESMLSDIIQDTGFETIAMERYTEMEPDDSLYVLLRRTAASASRTG